MPAFQLPGRNDPRFKALDEFTQAYLEAAIFTEEEELGGAGTVAVQQLADETLARMIFDCARFQRRAVIRNPDPDGVSLADAIQARFCRLGTQTHSPEAQAGHDFWLTRNGHGAGFWDGDWLEPAASRLDRLAKSFGQVDLYRGDDGRIYS